MMLSIVIPVYNERSTIEEVIRRVRAVPLDMEREIIIADDGSHDGTAEILKAVTATQPITVCRTPRQQGKGAAVRLGLQHTQGDIIAIQDADLEYAPEDYPRLLEPLVSGRTDVVYGSRFLQPLNHIRLATVLVNRIVVGVTNLLYGSTLTDVNTGHRMFRAEAIKQLPLKAEGFDIEAEITAKLLLRRYRITEIPISYCPRDVRQGKKIRWWDGFRILYCLVTCRVKFR